MCLGQGQGLPCFLARDADKERPLSQRPTLVLHEDQSSVNVCVRYVLLHLGLRLMPCRDEFHRVWNDSQVAVKRQGYHVVVKLV